MELARQAQGRLPEGPLSKDTAKATPTRDSKADPSKPKRPRKRPALAAVPDDEEDTSERSVEPAPLPSPSATARPVVSPLPDARLSEENGGSPRRRRELPPYLRVVK